MTRNFISTRRNFDDFESGYEQRLKEMNKKIYKIGKAGQESHSAMTEFDSTVKGITPIGGFPHYGGSKRRLPVDPRTLFGVQETLKRITDQKGEKCKDELQEKMLTAWPPLAWPLFEPRAIPSNSFPLISK